MYATQPQTSLVFITTTPKKPKKPHPPTPNPKPPHAYHLPTTLQVLMNWLVDATSEFAAVMRYSSSSSPSSSSSSSSPSSSSCVQHVELKCKHVHSDRCTPAGGSSPSLQECSSSRWAAGMSKACCGACIRAQISGGTPTCCCGLAMSAWLGCRIRVTTGRVPGTSLSGP